MNENDYSIYRPGLKKLIHHPLHLAKIQAGMAVSPLHLSVFPNNRCQLNCPYCCFKDTERTPEELSYEDFSLAVQTLRDRGLMALEFSGGGDPLLWSHFEKAVSFAKSRNLKLSLVTNGIAIPDISRDILGMFDWIRVSIQSAKYLEKINFDYIPDGVKKSTSFIVHNNSALKELPDIYNVLKSKNLIVRVAPQRPCSLEFEEQVKKETDMYADRMLFFYKQYGSPKACYMIWVRAALDWRGNFLPCPSIELTPEHFGKIPEDFSVCKIENLAEWLDNNPPHDMGYRCSFCNCGKDTNDYIHDMLEPMEDVYFV